MKCNVHTMNYFDIFIKFQGQIYDFFELFLKIYAFRKLPFTCQNDSKMIEYLYLKNQKGHDIYGKSYRNNYNGKRRCDEG